jgi:hypothetical protein
LVGGTAGFCGAAILGERYGKEKDREARKNAMHQDGRRPSVVLENSHHYQKVMNHVNKDYHLAFKEWLMN